MEQNSKKDDLQAAKITKLDDSVINRIAAGEIIQNPSNCVKELIENSIDAKAKLIQVTTKLGGLKSIQIVDNGTGILRENLEILAERFTTSKLKNYEDLQKMTTHGFRGEAISAISSVSRLTVQTKTRDQLVAYKAKYINGILTEEPVAVAGNQGTIITIEDLFYNVPVKVKTMTTDQFSKIFDVIAKYSIHNHHISFALKKDGEQNVIMTKPSDSPINAIRLIYGNAVAKSLLKIFIDNIGLKMKMEGYISKVDFNALKKSSFILFVNHRLVESKAIKKAVDEIYRKIIASGSFCPFIYMAIEVAPENVDVNVSPTKHEVYLLNEDLIVESIKNVVEETLMKTNETRVMYAQQLLPGAPKVIFETSKSLNDKVYAKDMIRTDPKLQSITKFLNNDDQATNSSSLQILPFSQTLLKSKNSTPSKLKSIGDLLTEVELNCDQELKKLVRNLKFVGNVNEYKSLIQSENILWMVSTKKLAQHLFYQLSLKNFSNFNAIQFKPLKLRELVKIGLLVKASETLSETHNLNEASIDYIERVLIEKSEMLQEYFKISINANGEIFTLPILCDGHAPLMSSLPIFIIRLVKNVSYDNEKKCFRNIAEELSKFYSQWSIRANEKDYQRLMQNIIFPKIRTSLLPPKEFLNDSTFLKMTSLQELYKVFERC